MQLLQVVNKRNDTSPCALCCYNKRHNNNKEQEQSTTNRLVKRQNKQIKTAKDMLK